MKGPSWKTTIAMSFMILGGCTTADESVSSEPSGETSPPTPQIADVSDSAVKSDTSDTTASDTPSGEAALPAGIGQVYPECEDRGNECSLKATLRFAPSGEELRAYAIDLLGDADGDGTAEATYVQGSGIVVFDHAGSLLWSSPLELVAGYGVQALATDATGHLFVDLAVSNHTGKVWVVDVLSDPVKTFGTMGADGALRVNMWTDPRDGRRELLSEWYMWLDEEYHQPGVNADLYAWDEVSRDYVFVACQHATDVSTRVEAGSPGCEQSHGSEQALLELEEKRIGAVSLGLLPDEQLAALRPLLGEPDEVIDEQGCQLAGPERRRKGFTWGDLTVWGEGYLDDTAVTNWVVTGPQTPVPVSTPFDTEVGMTASDVLATSPSIREIDDPMWGRWLEHGDIWWTLDPDGLVMSIESGERYGCE